MTSHALRPSPGFLTKGNPLVFSTRYQSEMPSTRSRPEIITTTNTYQRGSSNKARSESEDPFITNTLSRVPDFVLEYAPMVHLHSKEPFWPADLSEHLKNVVSKDPMDGRRLIHPPDHNPFDILNHTRFNHEKSFLTAVVDVRDNPNNHPWLVSLTGKPHLLNHHSLSKAILILVDKSFITGVPATLDAFWFFFYSFNLGPTVANIHFGNHIADWEHCMMRFEDGKPQAVHLSSHADGFAYTYSSLEKYKEGKRPVIYSALGSHAMYPKPGIHDYSPIKIIGPRDETERGPLWDPTLNYASFQHYPSPSRDKFRAIDASKDAHLVSCLTFRGQWGDQFSSPSPSSKEKEESSLDNNNNNNNNNWLTTLKSFHQPLRRTIGLYNLRWGDGVTGPRDKDLDRVGMNRFSNHIRTCI